MEHNTWQILILILTFNCKSSCLTPKLLCPPSHRATAEEVPTVPPASEAGWLLSRSALCLARGCQLPSFAGPCLLTSQKGLRLPAPRQSSCGQCCARLAFKASARPLHWVRRKCASKAELLRKHQVEHAGGTGRASCRGDGCSAGQTDAAKSLDRRVSCDQIEQNYLQMHKIKHVGESRNTEGIKSSALTSSWEDCQGNNNLPGF